MYMVDLYDISRQKELTDIITFLSYVYVISICVLLYLCFYPIKNM